MKRWMMGVALAMTTFVAADAGAQMSPQESARAAKRVQLQQQRAAATRALIVVGGVGRCVALAGTGALPCASEQQVQRRVATAGKVADHVGKGRAA